MPSPFPGMDPYLEGEMWQEFHETLAGAIRAQLLAVLPPQYVAPLAKRYVLNDQSVGLLSLPQEQRGIYPDVHVAHTSPRIAEMATAYEIQTLATPAAQLISPMVEEVPVMSVEVHDIANRRLVTIIEVLSPVNKMGEGAVEYARKRQDVLKTATHLLEIDLLRRGLRIVLTGELPWVTTTPT